MNASSRICPCGSSSGWNAGAGAGRGAAAGGTAGWACGCCPWTVIRTQIAAPATNNARPAALFNDGVMTRDAKPTDRSVQVRFARARVRGIATRSLNVVLTALFFLTVNSQTRPAYGASAGSRAGQSGPTTVRAVRIADPLRIDGALLESVYSTHEPLRD